ncbi:MAG TPA: hypothetical protein VFS67_10115 [Polyangiaceae bacterium]|jgi:hypothetical protein|nr:hypothetical protein [Polyangiaceae bacterium]
MNTENKSETISAEISGDASLAEVQLDLEQLDAVAGGRALAAPADSTVCDGGYCGTHYSTR